jgi:F0F1-type ATP synthase delta subunit
MDFKSAVGLSLLTINDRLKDIQKIIADPKKSVVDRFKEIHNEITELESLYDAEIKNLARVAAQLCPSSTNEK